MQAQPTTILTTHRLVLRQVDRQDSTAFLNIFADKEVMHYSDGVKDLAWIEDWIQHTQQHYHQFGYGKWAVVR
jgi:RimJ/RimL family protein N-acetyltransferase